MSSPTIDAALEEKFKKFICKRKGIDPNTCSLTNESKESTQMEKEDAEAKRQEVEEAEQKQLAEKAEQKRLAEEAEKQRLAKEEEARRLVKEEEKQQQEAEKQKQLAEEEKQRQEAEQKRKVEEEEVRQKIEQLQQSVERALNAQNDAETKLNIALATAQNTANELNNLKFEISSIESNKTELTSQIEQLKTELTSEKENLNNKIENVKTLTDKNINISSQLTEIENKLVNANVQYEDIQSVNEQLRLDIKSYNNENERLGQMVIDNDAKIKELESNQTASAEDIKKLKIANNKIRLHNLYLKDIYNKLNQDYESEKIKLQQTNDRLKELNNILITKNKEQENRITELSSRNDKLMSEIATSKLSLTDKEKAISEIKEANKLLDTQLAELREKCEDDTTKLKSKMHFNEFVCKVESNLNHMQQLHNSFEEFNLNAINLIQLTNKDATITSQQQEIASQQAKSTECNHKLFEERAILLLKDKKITDQQQEIATQQAKYTECNHKLFEERAIQLLKDATIVQKDATIKDNEATIVQKDTIIQAKDATIVQKDTTIKDNETIIQSKEREIAKLTQQAGSNLFNTFQKSVILTLSQMYDASQLQLAQTNGTLNWFQYFKDNVLLKLKYEHEMGLLSSQQQQCNTNHHSIFNANAINLILQASIADKDATIQAKDAEIADKDAEIANKDAIIKQQAGSNLYNTFTSSVILTLSKMHDASQLQVAITNGKRDWFQYFKDNVLLKLKYEHEMGLLSSQQQQCNTNHHSIFNAKALNVVLQQQQPVLPVNNANANYDLFQLHTIRQLEKYHQDYMQQALLFELFSNNSINIIRNQALIHNNVLNSNNYTLFNERVLCLLKSLVTSNTSTNNKPAPASATPIQLGNTDWVSAF